MANPMYGQNKADGMLNALADADATLAAAGTGSGSAGEAAATDATASQSPTKAISVTIEGVDYWIPLYTSNSQEVDYGW